MDREARLTQALGACLEGVRLAHREGQGTGADPARWGWVAVGMVSALKAALVAALSAYETANEDDITDPSNSDHIAPVSLLLRRARGTEYLNPPERLELPSSVSRRIERVLTLRNQTLHALGGQIDARIAEDMIACLDTIAHLSLQHPSFGPSLQPLSLALLKEEISACRGLLSAIG